MASLLSEATARRLLFILITVDDELNAYTVFETLNARGTALTTTDLLKNYLSLARKGPRRPGDPSALLETPRRDGWPSVIPGHFSASQTLMRKEQAALHKKSPSVNNIQNRLSTAG